MFAITVSLNGISTLNYKPWFFTGQFDYVSDAMDKQPTTLINLPGLVDQVSHRLYSEFEVAVTEKLTVPGLPKDAKNNTTSSLTHSSIILFFLNKMDERRSNRLSKC